MITALAAWIAGCNGVSVVGSGNPSDSAVTDLGGDASTMDVTCAAGQILCSGACVATSNSVEHCGGCGRTCRTGAPLSEQALELMRMILGGRLNDALAMPPSRTTHEVATHATRALEHHIERRLRTVAMFET